MFPDEKELEIYRSLPWHSRSLFYGWAGAGKTALAVSSFWDWEGGQQIANGRLLTFGGEYNEALGVPEELIRRFKSPSLTDNKWATELERYTTALVKDAATGKLELDAIVFDGFSEFDMLYEGVADAKGTDKFEKYDGLLMELYANLSRLDPEVLGCDVLATARVQEKRKAKASRTGRDIPGDPDYMTSDFYPAMRGTMRYSLPHYFNNVFFMEEQLVLMPGKAKRESAHALTAIHTGGYLVKNQHKHLWVPAGLPPVVYNQTWPQLKLTLARLRKGEAVEAEEVEEAE